MKIQDEEDDDGYLAEVVQKSSIGIVAFAVERTLLTGVAYLVTTLFGAASYGFLSVFIRGEVISRNLVAGLGDGYTRIVPGVSASAQRTLLSVGTTMFVVVWAVIVAVVVGFRESIVELTFLEPRHERVVVLFAIGLLPFLMLRNIRDILRALRRIKLAMLVSRIFMPLTLLGGATFAVLIGGQSLFDIWIGIVIVAIILTIASVFLLAYYTEVSVGPFQSHRSVVRKFLRYSVDATSIAILEVVQWRAVSVVMALYLSPVVAGAFSFSIVIGLVVRWPLSGINNILPPIAASLYGNKKKQTLQQLYQQTSRLATVAATPVFVLGYAYAPELLAIVNEVYAQESIIFRLILVAQYVATIFGSVGLLLMMTDNERASLLVQALNAIISLPLMIVLTIRLGSLGLGIAYLLSLSLNNTMELFLLYFRDGFVPFSREQTYTILIAVLSILVIVLTKSVAGFTVSAVIIALAVISYAWAGRRFLLRQADRAVLGALL